MKRLSIIGLAVIMVMGLAATSWATSVSFTGTSGNLAASVQFSLTGTTLTVTLTNTSTHDVLVPADVLTGVFFNTGGQSLTPASATVASGSAVLFGPSGGGNVGGEWAYAQGISQYGANAGISSSGLGIFGNGNFGGPNLQDPAAVDGLNYGILSAGDNTTTGNNQVNGVNGIALIKNSVVFTFTVDAGFDLSKISGITFQYGTALDEPHFGVPEPSTFLLLGAGLLGVGLLRRKFRK